MELDEFKNLLNSINHNLINDIKRGQSLTKVSDDYLKKYELLIKSGLNSSCDDLLIEHVAFNLYAKTVLEHGLAMQTDALNLNAIPLINNQIEVNSALKNANSKLVGKIDKNKSDRVKGAKIRHQETDEFKAEIIADYKINKSILGTKEEAAIHYTKIYPLKYGTIRNYLKNQ